MTDKHLQLVAFSRTKRTYAMYGSEDDLDEMRKRAATPPVLSTAATTKGTEAIDSGNRQINSLRPLMSDNTALYSHAHRL